jgi:PilZ domain
VLLINQVPKTTRVFQEAARSVGAELHPLETFEQAGRSVREDRFEAIFVDPTVPNFSRQGFTSLVRHSPFNSQTPIVLIMSLYAEELNMAESLNGVSVMARPLKSDELLPYLKELKQKLLADRRNNRRLDYRARVNCVQGGRRLKAISVNICTTGILLEMSWVPKRGDEIELHLQLGEDEPAFRGLARVARLEGPGRAALGFHNLGPIERERLRRFVDAHLPALR